MVTCSVLLKTYLPIEKTNIKKQIYKLYLEAEAYASKMYSNRIKKGIKMHFKSLYLLNFVYVYVYDYVNVYV